MSAAHDQAGSPGALVKLAGFLLPVALVMSALWPLPLRLAPGPALALPLYFVAAAVVLGIPARTGYFAVLSRWMQAGFWLMLLGLVLLAALSYWPLARLLSGAGLIVALLAGAVPGLALVTLWRFAVLPVLLLEPASQTIAARRAALGDEAVLGASGWIAATCFLLVLIFTLALAWPPAWSTGTYRIALPLHALVVAPALCCLGLAAARRQLEAARRRVADALVARATAVPQPLRREAIVDLDAALYAAARAGSIDEALALLEMGADPHAMPVSAARDQRTVLMLAAIQPDLRLLRALIGAGVDLNRSHAGLTPLLAAVRDSYHGRPDAVLMLLANGADPRATDADGATALHAAARNADPSIAALLLDAGAEPDALDAQGVSALGVAAAQGNLELARFLLSRGAGCEPAGGEPALLLATGGPDADPAMLGLLLQHKAKVDARGRLGRTALHGACLHGNLAAVEALLATRAQPDPADDLGVTPLMEAARAGASACIRRLAGRGGIDPAARDQAGRNALAIACQSGAGDSETVRLLLELGVDPQQAAHDGRRAIDHAVAAGRWSHVALLDPGYVLPACLSEDDEALQDIPPLTRLRLAVERASLTAVRELLPLSVQTPAEQAALYLELAPRLPLALARILARGLATEPRLPEGDTLVWQLLALGPVADQALRAVLERGAAPAGRGGLARYLDAALLQVPSGPTAQQTALALLASGADPFAPGAGAPPLHQALQLRWHGLVHALLACGVDPDGRDPQGATPLMLACRLDDEAMVRSLVRHGAQPAARAPDGQTAQGMSLALRRPHLARWLSWPHWPVPRRPLRNDDLVAAARVGDTEAVANLLGLGLELDATDARGCTALLRACGGGHLELVRELLARGADPALAADSGATCLSVAVTARHDGVVRALAAHGVDVDQRLPGGITPLMLAAALGQDETVDILLRHGADPGAVDEYHGTTLHALAQFGFGAHLANPAVAIWESLLAAGADPDADNALGETPLHLLLGASFEPGTACREEVLLPQVDVLLRRRVNLAARERRGFGPLHLAALHGLGVIVQRLLAAGADVNLRDNLNRRPAEIALMRGYVDIASAFLPGSAPPSIARFLRETRD